MRDRNEAILHFIAEAEIALAKVRAELAIGRLDAAMGGGITPEGRALLQWAANGGVPEQRPRDVPVAALNDDPPSRPA